MWIIQNDIVNSGFDTRHSLGGNETKQKKYGG